MTAPRHTADNITDDALDDLYAERNNLRAELDDWRHNVSLRAFTAPDADLDTVLASLDARIRDALAAGTEGTNPPMLYGDPISCRCTWGKRCAPCTADSDTTED